MKIASCQGKYINLVYFVYPRWYVIPLKEVVKCRSNNPTTAYVSGPSEHFKIRGDKPIWWVKSAPLIGIQDNELVKS